MALARAFVFIGAMTLLAGTASPAEAPKVVATIKPLHALVSAVMAGVGTPELLVKGVASPHTYALKPSEARLLNHADLFFRVSGTVEPFTRALARSLPTSVAIVTVQNARGLKLLPLRVGTTFDRYAGYGRAHAGEQDDAPQSGAVDGHIWLDPDNAQGMVDSIEEALSSRAPSFASVFKANAESLKTKIADLSAELDRELRPIRGKPYIVFHDAFQYFERRYGLNAVGSIAISPELPPSGKRLSELREKIVAMGAICVFAEPQSDRRLVQNLVEGTSARIGTLDPEGGRLEPGPDLYFVLMHKLADDLKTCLLPPA